MIVKAAVARHPQSSLKIETLDLDEPRADELLVRLVASGVASRDLRAIAGRLAFPLPFVAGGEGAGIVERIGPGVENVTPGDTVLLTFAACGHCPNCLNGTPAVCVQRAALNQTGMRQDGSTPLFADGEPIHGFFEGQSSFATHVLCRASSVVKVPVDTALEVLACIGGDYWTAAGAIIHGFSPAAADTLVIAGAGGPGLVALMSARALRIKQIIVADPDGERRALASDLGASLTVHTDEDLGAVIRSMTGAGARYALDTVGDRSSLEACLGALAPGGTCGTLHAVSDDMPLDPASTRQIVAMANGCGSPQDVIGRLVSWHAEGRFPIEKLVAFFPFEHINDALHALATHAVIKPIVRFSLGSFAGLDRAAAEGAAVEEPADEEHEVPTDAAPVAIVALD